MHEDIWDNPSHEDWDALEAKLDAIPPPTMTGEITFGRPGTSLWRLRLARWINPQRKEYPLEVIIHQHPGEGPDGWLSTGVGPKEEEAARNYCEKLFSKAGLEIDTIVVTMYGAGHDEATIYLIVTVV